MLRAFSLARDNAGKSIAARIAMTAMTTSSSINVKAICFWIVFTSPPGVRPLQKSQILILILIFPLLWRSQDED